MGINCAHLVADLFLFYYEIDSMLSLSDSNQSAVFVTFYLPQDNIDGSLNIDNPYFEQMVSEICPTELQIPQILKPFLELDLSITNGIVFT